MVLTYSFYAWENAVKASRHFAQLGARQRVYKIPPTEFGQTWQLRVTYEVPR